MVFSKQQSYLLEDLLDMVVRHPWLTLLLQGHYSQYLNESLLLVRSHFECHAHPLGQKHVKEATSLAAQREIIAATLKRGKDRAR